jgi:predicted SAM-dependent methyltransferase
MLTANRLGRYLDRKLARPVRVYFANRADLRRLKGLTERPRRLILGASGTSIPGWHHTDQRYLDLLKPAQWQRLFEPGTIDALLAEHVWEHLTPEAALAAARTCFTYLAPGAALRAAVPDGLHPDPAYIEWVRPGGSGAGADDHKILYDYRSFGRVFEQAGFRVELLEYFDESGTFHATEWSNERGYVGRSARYDQRNAGGRLAYTSLILDAVKP